MYYVFTLHEQYQFVAEEIKSLRLEPNSGLYFSSHNSKRFIYDPEEKLIVMENKEILKHRFKRCFKIFEPGLIVNDIISMDEWFSLKHIPFHSENFKSVRFDFDNSRKNETKIILQQEDYTNVVFHYPNEMNIDTLENMNKFLSITQRNHCIRYKFIDYLRFGLGNFNYLLYKKYEPLLKKTYSFKKGFTYRNGFYDIKVTKYGFEFKDVTVFPFIDHTSSRSQVKESLNYLPYILGTKSFIPIGEKLLALK